MDLKELQSIIIGNGQEPDRKNRSPKRFYVTDVVEMAVYSEPQTPRCFVLNFHSTEREWVNVVLANASGKILLQKDMKSRTGFNKFHFDLRSFPDGSYKFTLLSTQGAQSKTVELIA